MSLLQRLGAIFLLFFSFANALFAQIPTELAQAAALRFLQADPASWGLESADVTDVHITDAYPTKHNGLTHVWIQQQHRRIPVAGALIGLHIQPDGTVLHLGHRFVAGLSRRANTNIPALRPVLALDIALRNLGFSGFPTPPVRQKLNDQNYIFEGGSVSTEPIPVTLCYEPLPDGSVRLAWFFSIATPATSDHWNYSIDAQTGVILKKINTVLYCKAGHPTVVQDACIAAPHQLSENGKLPERVESYSFPESDEKTTENGATPAYRVLPLPVESPAHGNRSLVIAPQSLASPFGWHDINGIPGQEYTYTRGNNAWAYEDSGNLNSGSEAKSAAGGANLNFDFPFDPNAAPAQNKDAAITNLFYMTNMMHDLFYSFGFDEPAGNYQVNNYGKTGNGGDPVLAEALDGSGENNANFDPTPDGFIGRMQMYTWSRQGGRLLKVNAPAGPLEGLYSVSTTLSWGGTITSAPLTGDVVIANDGTGSAGTLACNSISNTLAGKIAMIDRGDCAFRQKAYNVEQAGAIACVICNVTETQIALGPGTTGLPVTIPVVMLRKSDCDRIRSAASNGLNITLVLPPSTGPDYLDGSFDNGIIAHEYTHGISNRLTGGPNTSICLQNKEHMGEGWSDFFALVTTVNPGDLAGKNRSIGTYVIRENNAGAGIRTYPYSTDLSINPLTYEFIIDNTYVHTVGEVWAATLWDLYWAMIDRYGYDQNWNNKNSGNARAIQLVIDGMKIQPCNPGFLDGRNAILKADTVNYKGANSCLIWNVFARRGLGFDAKQGTSYSAIDGKEGFALPPSCDKRLIISKTSPANAAPGENLAITLTVRNQQDKIAENVVITDELPEGLLLLSASNGGTVNNSKIIWALGNIAPGQNMTLTYQVQTDALKGSVRLYRNVMETEDWLRDKIKGGDFELQNLVSKTGNFAWKAPVSIQESDFSLSMNENDAILLSGAHPALRFWHRYETEAGADGGIVEIRDLTTGSEWVPLTAGNGIRNNYPGRMQYRTFTKTQINSFSGNSGNWIQSYFDLRQYAGKKIAIRYRFGTDEGHGSVISTAWFIDDTEVLDLLRYDGVACVTATGTASFCAKAPEGGTVMGFPVVDTDEPDKHSLRINIVPNPVTDWLQVVSMEDLPGISRFSLYDANGRVMVVMQKEFQLAGQAIEMDVRALPAGFYTLKVESQSGVVLQKVVK